MMMKLKYWAFNNFFGGKSTSAPPEPEVPFNTHSLVVPSLGTGIEIQDNSLYPTLGSLTDTPCAFEIAFKPTLMANLGYIVRFGDDSGAKIVLMHGSSGQARIDFQSSSGNRISAQTGGNKVILNSWNHILFTYDGSKTWEGLKIYVDNQLLTTVGTTSTGTYTGLPALSGNLTLRFPIIPGTEATKYIGKINLFRMYDEIPTENERNELFKLKGPRSIKNLDIESKCILEHWFNNNQESSIGTDAIAVGSVSYDTDIMPSMSIPGNILNFTPTVLDSIYWPSILKSSDWPEIVTTKPYFTIYSTDHSTAGGGIAWGECDDMFGNGFIERGVIISGNQAETPYLVRVPISVSSLTSDELFIFYHTVTGEPGNDGKQQTRLITTTGGALHTATWTDRGRPLGIFNDDVHTGYCRVRINSSNKLIAQHLTVGGSSPKSYTSISDDGLTFTRLIETTGRNVDGYSYIKNEVCDFKWNNIQYGFVAILVDGLRKIAVVTLDENFLPVEIIEILDNYYDIRQMMASVEGSTAYIRFKGGDNTNRFEPYYQITYDLNQLI